MMAEDGFNGRPATRELDMKLTLSPPDATSFSRAPIMHHRGLFSPHRREAYSDTRQTGAVLLATPGNEGRDPELTGPPAALVVVVAAVGVRACVVPGGAGRDGPHWGDRVDERHQPSRDRTYTFAEAR